jgi:hypothetical protein
MNLEFKDWLATESPLQASYKGGWGYGSPKGEQPGIATRVGNDVVSGLGGALKKRLGAAFPTHGSTYQNFLEPLSKWYSDGKDFLVVKTIQYDKEHDEFNAKLNRMTKEQLDLLRKSTEIERAALAKNCDIKQRPRISYEPATANEQGNLHIVYRFKPQPAQVTNRLRPVNI